VGFKGIIAATAAVALMAAPTVAAAQTEVAPATESIEEGSQLRGGFIIPLIAIIAIILGILELINDDDHNLPKTP
jgi:hypothetical protein